MARSPSDHGAGRDAAHSAEHSAGEAARGPRVRPHGDHVPVLPERAAEDREEAWGDAPASRDEDWYRRERPPHHE